MHFEVFCDELLFISIFGMDRVLGHVPFVLHLLLEGVEAVFHLQDVRSGILY